MFHICHVTRVLRMAYVVLFFYPYILASPPNLSLGLGVPAEYFRYLPKQEREISISKNFLLTDIHCAAMVNWRKGPDIGVYWCHPASGTNT